MAAARIVGMEGEEIFDSKWNKSSLWTQPYSAVANLTVNTGAT
jgi:hypothetical protein